MGLEEMTPEEWEEWQEQERDYWGGELGTEGECNLHNRQNCGSCN